MRKFIYIALFAVFSYESVAAAAGEVEVRESRGPFARLGAWIASCCAPNEGVLEAAMAARPPVAPHTTGDEGAVEHAEPARTAARPEHTEEERAERAETVAPPTPYVQRRGGVAASSIAPELDSTRTIRVGAEEELSPVRDLSNRTLSQAELASAIPAAAVAAPSAVHEEASEVEEDDSPRVTNIGETQGDIPVREFRAIMALRQDPVSSSLLDLSLRNPEEFLRTIHSDWSEDQIQAELGNRDAIQRLHPDWTEEEVQEAVENAHRPLSRRAMAALEEEYHEPQVETPEGLDDDDDDDDDSLQSAVGAPIAMASAVVFAADAAQANPAQDGEDLTHQQAIEDLEADGAFGPYQGAAGPAAEAGEPGAVAALPGAVAAAALPGAVEEDDAAADEADEPVAVAEGDAAAYLAADNTYSTIGSISHNSEASDDDIAPEGPTQLGVEAHHSAGRSGELTDESVSEGLAEAAPSDASIAGSQSD